MPKKKQVFEPENLESIRSAISGLIVEPPETIEPDQRTYRRSAPSSGLRFGLTGAAGRCGAAAYGGAG